MNSMKLLRHKLTGIAGFYPAHFADFDYFEEVVDLEEPCTDCVAIDVVETKKKRTKKEDDNDSK